MIKYFIMLISITFFSTIFANEENITIITVGDIMMGSTYPEENLPEEDGKNLMKEAFPYFKKGDIVFGNLEGPLADEAKLGKKCKNPKSCYAFKTPTSFVKNLTDAGFNFLSIANNHSGDFGDEGRNSTMKTLDDNNIVYSGVIGKIAYKEIKNKKTAMIAFSPNAGIYDINNIPEAVKLVKDLKSKNDLVLVSFHGGAEGKNATKVTEGTEEYLGEKRGDLIKFSKSVIDAGADIVIGHGPHVPRGIDIYKNKLIIYSLGNFCTYGGISVSGVLGYAPLMIVNIDKDGNFINGNIISFIQQYKGNLKYDKTNIIPKFMKNLTIENFPDSKIKINDDGSVELIK